MKIFKPSMDALKAGKKAFGASGQKAASIAIGAGVAAPFLFYDEDRGLANTALVTTPLVAAGFVAAPGLNSVFNRTRGSLGNLRNAGSLFKRGGTLADVNEAAAKVDRKIFAPFIKQASDSAHFSAYDVRELRRNKPVNMEQFQNRISKHLAELKDEELLGTTYAMRQAERRGLSLSQLKNSNVKNNGMISGAMSRQELAASYERYKDNPKFLREFNKRLGRLKNVSMPSNLPVQGASNFTSSLRTHHFDLQYNEDALRSALGSRKSLVVDNLLRNKDFINHDIQVVSQATVAGGNKPVALVVNRGHGKSRQKLAIYLQDEETGAAMIGSRFNRVAASRHVTYGDVRSPRIAAPDVFIAGNLNQDWKALRLERDRLFIHHMADPDNAYDMVTKRDQIGMMWNPRAAKIRALSATGTSLPLYKGLSGADKAYGDLGIDERGTLMESFLRKGNVVMHSEGSVIRSGTVSAMEASLMEPFGIPNPAKQSNLIRSLGKGYDVIEQIPEHLRAGVITSYTRDTILNGGQLPGFKATIGGVSPGQRNFMGEVTAQVRDSITGTAFEKEVRAWAANNSLGAAKFNKQRGRYLEANRLSGYKAWATQRARGILGTESAQKKLSSIVLQNMTDAAKARAVGSAEEHAATVARNLTHMMTGDLDMLRAGEVIAQLGEGDIALNEGIYGKFHMYSARLANVDTVLQEDLSQFVAFDKETGKFKDNWEALAFGEETALGSYKDQFITGRRGPKGGRTLLMGFEKDAEGQTRLHLADFFKVGDSATKINIGERKGLVAGIEDDVLHKGLRVLNEFGYQTGQGRTLSRDVTGLGLQTYHHANLKSGDTYLNILNDTVRTAVGNFGSAVEGDVNTLAERLQRLGIVRENGQLVEMSDYIARYGAYSKERSDRVQDIMSAAEEFFQRVEGHIGNSYGSLINNTDPLVSVNQAGQSVIPHNSFGAFASWMQAHPEQRGLLGQGTLLPQFMFRNNATDTALPWDSSAQGVGKRATVTWEELMKLHHVGQHSMVKEILTHGQYMDGDPYQMADFAQHLSKGDFAQPYGSVVADPGRKFTQLSKLEGRAGTMFDPSMEQFSNPFSVQLNEPAEIMWEGKKTRMTHLPHAGWGAHGMHPNNYDTFSFSSKDHPIEGKFNAVFGKSGEELNAAAQAYMDSYKELIAGKNGFQRARITDPRGVNGFIRTTTVKTENPFDAYVSRDIVDAMPAQERKTLLAGDSVYGLIGRQPISDVSVSRIRYNPDMRLGENQIAYGEGFRITRRSDDDLDRFTLNLFRDEESIAAAKASLRKGSFQHEMYETMRALRNVEDTSIWNADIARATLEADDPLAEVAKAAGIGQSEYGLTKAARLAHTRQAGATIGQYSNFLTSLEMAAVDHPELGGDRNFIRRAIPVLFQARQVPITLQKDAKGDLLRAGPMELLDELKTAWSNAPTSQDAANNFVNKFAEVSRIAAETSNLNQDVVDRLGLTRGHVWDTAAKKFQVRDLVDADGRLLSEFSNGASRINAAASVMDFSEDFRSQMANLAQNQSARSAAAARMNLMAADDVQSIGQAMRMYRESLGAMPFSAARPVSGATADAVRSIGAVNKTLTNAAREVKQAFGPAMPILAAGLGVAAIAGAMMVGTSSKRTQAPPPPRSARPEVAVGATDHVPGEPVAGSEAPAGPKRFMTQAPEGVRTAVVGQMRPNHHMEVKSRGPYRNDQRESERTLENLVAAGDTNITRSYVGGWRQTSLRDREQMKDDFKKDRKRR